MTIIKNDFRYTQEKQIHGERAKAILKKYPKVKELTTKKNPWGIFIILGLVSLQVSLAILLKQESFMITFLAALFIGTIINHGMIALVHECSHNLLFKPKTANMLSCLLVNLSMFIPSAVSFRKYHLKHHSQMGIYDIDADLPSKWEVKVVKNIWYRKCIWLFLFPLLQTFRTSRVQAVAFMDMWVLTNMVLTISFDVLIYYFFGPVALFYLACSMWLGFGLSVVGGRIIQEHFIFKEGQETYSYYGLLNIPSLNVGMHTEHHDFPTIPWNYLPKLHKMAPEFYEHFYSHNSWLKVVFRFIFDGNVSLGNRLIRT